MVFMVFKMKISVKTFCLFLVLIALVAGTILVLNCMFLCNKKSPLPSKDFAYGIQEIENNIKISYVYGGDRQKPALLLIPGWPQTWYIYRHIMPQLAKDYFVIAVDPKGIGLSSKPESGYDAEAAAQEFNSLMLKKSADSFAPSKSGYDTGTVAGELNSFMQKIGITKYSIIGHDIGMWIGYAIASDFPDSVQKLIVTEASIPGVTEFPDLMVPRELIKFRAQFLFNRLPELPELLVTGREDKYLNYIFKSMAYDVTKVAAKEYIRAYKQKGAMKAGFEYYRAIPETKKQNEARMQKKLQIPVLAIGGDKSGKLGPLKTMEKAAVNVTGKELNNCGHYTPEENPDQFLEVVIPFLKG